MIKTHMGQFDSFSPGENSFVIPRRGSSERIFTMHEGGGSNPDLWKKIALVVLFIAFLGSMALIFWRGKQLESVADVRNFAVEEPQNPTPWSFDQYPVSEAQTFPQEQPIAIGTVAPVREVPSTPASTPVPTSVRVQVPVVTGTRSIIPTGGAPQGENNSDSAVSPTESVSQQLLSCNRVEWFKGAVNITGLPNVIARGDTIRFVGSASASDVGVKSLTFRHSIGGQVIEEVERPANLVDGIWTAEYTYVFDVYGQHRITVIAVTPQ